MKPRKINLDFKEYIRIKDTYNCITIGEEENAVTIRFFKTPSMYTKLDKECKKDELPEVKPFEIDIPEEKEKELQEIIDRNRVLSSEYDVEDEIKEELHKDYDVVPREEVKG